MPPSTESLAILAHRALLAGSDPPAENRVSAIRRAVRLGFGVEFDVRADPEGRLFLSHDPAEWEEDRDLGAFLADPGAGPHALNVKDLATVDAMLAAIDRADARDRLFLFDFELAGGGRDACRQLMREVTDRGFAVAHRLSEREPFLDVLLASPPAAAWLDEFERPWVESRHIAALTAAGVATYYVSPELHRPTGVDDLRRRWYEVIAYGVTGICTDYPIALREHAGGTA